MEDTIQGQVIRAARQLYQQHGLHKVTMEDVAKAVGKGKSSLYYYYKSKEEIFDAVISVEIEEIFAQIAKEVGKVKTTEEKIRVYCSTRLKLARKKKTSFSTMEMNTNADEMANYALIKQTLRKKFVNHEHTLFKEILLAGVERGEVRRMPGKELDAVVFVIMSSFRGLKQEIIKNNNREHEKAAAKTIAALVMNGLKR